VAGPRARDSRARLKPLRDLKALRSFARDSPTAAQFAAHLARGSPQSRPLAA
jgi:hypothetical protein